MHRTNLVERELRRPRSTQTTPTKRVVPASRFPNRDPTATPAKRPRRNARRPTAFVANERGQRNAKPVFNAARLRSDDPLVANPARPRINQLERRLDDAPKRRASLVWRPLRTRFRFYFQQSFLYSFETTRPPSAAPLFRPLYAKNAAPQATKRYKPPFRRKKTQKEKSRSNPLPLPNGDDFGYNKKQR